MLQSAEEFTRSAKIGTWATKKRVEKASGTKNIKLPFSYKGERDLVGCRLVGKTKLINVRKISRSMRRMDITPNVVCCLLFLPR